MAAKQNGQQQNGRGPTETERRVAAGETVKIGLITYAPTAPAGARDVVRDGSMVSYREPRRTPR